MAATRRAGVIDIFQDAPLGFEADLSTLNSTFSSQSHFSSPLDESLSLPPPVDQFGSSLFAPDDNLLPLQGEPSPRKQAHKSSSPLRHVFSDRSNISLPPPAASTPRNMGSPVKRPATSIYQPIAMQRPSTKPLFATFPPAAATNKENLRPSHRSDNFAEFPGPDYGPKSKGKRTLLETGSLDDRLSKKARAHETTQPPLPEPHEMPAIDDDGGKPPYSYATLIGMSILRAPNRRLTLAQIYKWISDTFSHYRAAESGWQNSIRHNLSLSKDFIKKDRPKDDPGKGNYWTIMTGEEHKFVKEKPCRRPASSSGGHTKASQLSSDLHLTLTSTLTSTSTSTSKRPTTTETSDARASSKIRAIEPSSDATIPASDPALQDDHEDLRGSMPPPKRRGSSPAAHLGSSPPQMTRPRSSRGGSPALGHDLSSSANLSRKRKRKCNALNDSGYYSSLDVESSALRPHGVATDGGALAPMYKRGRAEEEIARIRSSSHDISPTKGASMAKSRYQYLSSSPSRSAFHAPLTPGLTFKMPAKPPPSVSPNTNLRNHRNKIRALVGSPVKHSEFPEVSYGFSPAFHIVEDDPFHFHESPRFGFNIFSDSVEDRRANGSPVKRKTRRTPVSRPPSGARVAGLADITNTNGNRLHPTTTAPFLRSPMQARSPSKSPVLLQSPDFPAHLGHSDLFGLDLFANDGDDDFDGLDLMQGFQKIGDKENSKVRNLKPHQAPRPALGARSATTNF